MFLPLLVVALVGCGNKNNPALTREAANARVVAAVEKTMEETFKSVELTAAVDALISNKMKDNTGAVIHTNRIEVNGNAALKAKDLDKETAQIALTASAGFKLYNDDVKNIDVSGDVGFYYVDNFAHLNLGLSNYDGSSGQTSTINQKQKMDVGPFPGLPTEEDLDDLFGQQPEEVDDTEAMEELLAGVGSITATEKNEVLTVVYEIKQADLAKIVWPLVYGVLGTDELTSEQTSEMLSELESMINEVVLLRKAKITVVVGKTGYLNGLSIDLDLDVTTVVQEWQPATESLIELKNIVTVKGSVDLGLKINEAVTISFPNFSQYALVDEFDFGGILS